MAEAECRRLVARSGTKVRCLSGHHICDIVKDLHLGDTSWAENFGNWQQPQPEIGGHWGACQTCGDWYAWPGALHYFSLCCRSG